MNQSRSTWSETNGLMYIGWIEVDRIERQNDPNPHHIDTSTATVKWISNIQSHSRTKLGDYMPFGGTKDSLKIQAEFFGIPHTRIFFSLHESMFYTLILTFTTTRFKKHKKLTTNKLKLSYKKQQKQQQEEAQTMHFLNKNL